MVRDIDNTSSGSYAHYVWPVLSYDEHACSPSAPFSLTVNEMLWATSIAEAMLESVIFDTRFFTFVQVLVAERGDANLEVDVVASLARRVLRSV